MASKTTYYRRPRRAKELGCSKEAQIRDLKFQLTEANTYKDAFRLCEKSIAEKERELALNAKMLARQTDLAREAETQLTELRGKVKAFLNLLDETPLTPQNHIYYPKAKAALRAAVEKPTDQYSQENALKGRPYTLLNRSAGECA